MLNEASCGARCLHVIFILWFLVFRYGQMTAGSYCYIGPQGIVHGTLVCAVIKKG